MKFVDTILYIEYQEALLAGVPEGTLKAAQHRKSQSWTFIDDPEDRRKVLIGYEAMKPQYKDLVKQKLCGGLDPYAFLATRIIGKELLAKISDTTFFGSQDMKSSTRERAIEACRYLHLLERCRLSSQKKSSFPMWSTDEFWQYLTAHIKGNPILREKNGVNLPTVKPRLNHLAKLYIEHGAMVVLNRRTGNKNSSKLGKLITTDGSGKQYTGFDEELYKTQLAVLLRLRAHPNNLDFVQIADHYNQIAKESNWASLTNMQVMNILKEGKSDLVTTAWRRGKENFRNEKSIQVKRRPPSQPLMMVTVDGWDVELAYQEMVLDKKGKRHTRYDNRLVVVIILDPFMKYPVGYAVDTAESAGLIKRAMKNGIDHIFEVTGQYVSPYQVQSDHYALSEMKVFYEKIARVYTPARVENAKAKVIEPYFKYLNKKYCQLLYNWTGFGITSRRENQPNFKLKNEIKNTYPDRGGVLAQIDEIIAAERQAKAKEYFAALEGAEKRMMDRKDYLRILGIPKERTVKASGKGLIMSVEKADYVYDTLNIEFRAHLHRNWKVTYDPDDMKTVLVEDQEGKISFILEEKYIQPMAIADQTPEDREQLKALKASNKDLDSAVISANIDNIQRVEEHLGSTERLQEFRQKLMFTRGGQQKDPLQEAKGKMLPEERDRKAIQKSIADKKRQEELQELADQAAYEEQWLALQEKRWDEKIDFSKF